MKNESSKSFAFGITIIATLGGLLFGYDTAVISGYCRIIKAYIHRIQWVCLLILQVRWKLCG